MHNDTENVVQSWLDLQCELLVGLQRAIVLVGDPGNGPVLPGANWPDGKASTPALSNAAAASLQQRRFVVRDQSSAPEAARQEGDVIAVPVLRDADLVGAVAVELTPRSASEREAAVKTLARNTVWLELLMRRQPDGNGSRAFAVVDLVAAAIEQTRFEAAANTVLTRLATHLGCERVSLGFLRGTHVDVRTTSGTATLNPKMRLTKAVGMAMDEALSQDATIVFPAPDRNCYLARRCHEEQAKLSGVGAVCTVPLAKDGELVGAMTFEHDQPFEPATTQLIETVVSLLGPILHDKFLQDRWFGAKLSAALGEQLGKLAGRGHLVAKTCAAALVLAVAVLATATGEYRVTADATLEGTVQRMVVAPVDGYITEAPARAGDIVEAGQVLARLDDKDLELLLHERTSEQAQLQREYRQAMSELDSTRVNILKAQLDQVAARLELTRENLERTRATSPMDGIIISGDLSQSLGTPVSRGDTLFEVAPLDSYRVMLQVDERDVRRLSPGQTGRLALVGFPDDYLPFAIERVTPVATAAEGRNFFAVEARLEDHPDVLRPGMEGVAKVDIGERKLIWIWSHRLVDWMRLATWTWVA